MAAADEEYGRQEVARYEALAEAAYSEMYETRSPAGSYSELKECFAMAIGTAERAGLHDEAKRMKTRLDHCKQVYRSQFSGF